VIVDGKTIGTTPFEETVAHGDAQRTYTLKKDGYEPASATLAADADAARRVTLKKKRRATVTTKPDDKGGVNPFD
jgi:hypothetical protein